MHPYLLPVYVNGPRILARLVSLISADRWGERLAPDRFNVREVVAHLADWEEFNFERIKAGVERPGSTVELFDEARRAIEFHYDSLDPVEQARLLIERRERTAQYLSALEPEEWQKSFVHPERGPMTVFEQANMSLGHDLYHVEQLVAYLDA